MIGDHCYNTLIPNCALLFAFQRYAKHGGKTAYNNAKKAKEDASGGREKHLLAKYKKYGGKEAYAKHRAQKTKATMAEVNKKRQHDKADIAKENAELSAIMKVLTTCTKQYAVARKLLMTMEEGDGGGESTQQILRNMEVAVGDQGAYVKDVKVETMQKLKVRGVVLRA